MLESKVRKVLYISGSRADYGPARRVLKAIRAQTQFDLSLLVTSMHLDPAHGETWQEIADDNITISERIYGRITGDSLEVMAASVGLYLYGMSLAMARIRPDIVLVLGDRGEQLAGAMAASFQNITVVHLCGGSRSGSIDDSIRHAITKFAHYHLPALEEHAHRIIQMGEEPSTVEVVGLPGGDIRPDVVFSREHVCREYHLPTDRLYLLVIQHPVTHSQKDAAEQITETLEAVASLEYPVLLANPNDDAGGQRILAKMQEYVASYPQLHILKPPRSRELFASIMAHAGALVGNSSSGIVEAMSVHLPVVNIGDRQRGREKYACLMNAPYERKAIKQAILTALNDQEYRSRLAKFESPFIRNTEQAVVKFLLNLDLSAASRPKKFFNIA